MCSVPKELHIIPTLSSKYRLNEDPMVLAQSFLSLAVRAHAERIRCTQNRWLYTVHSPDSGFSVISFRRAVIL